MWECATRRLPFADLKTSWAIRRAVEEGQRPEIPDNLPPSESCLSGALMIVSDCGAKIRLFFVNHPQKNCASVRRTHAAMLGTQTGGPAHL